MIRSPDESWVVLFYYASTAASMLLPERRGLAIVVLSGVATALTLSTMEDPASAAIQGLSVSVIGVTIFAMAALRRTNAQLHAARRELATRAVADERNRIARDLHDVLGHSLSLIAIKSELAGRLLPAEPERAKVEIADVERVAREALASVRETVSGYRQPTLDRELDNARTVLDAAGIEPTIEHLVGPLPASEDAVLAWAVREAVTNVVRHSAARHGTIRTLRRAGQAELEVLDDGRGDELPGLATGDASGLVGLHERLERAGGRLEAGPRPTGGYRLFASVPIAPHRRPGVTRSAEDRDGPIRVLLAEDQAMVLGAMAALISMEDDLEVVGQVARGDDVVPHALRLGPDVAVLDIEMPGMDGLAAAAALHTALPGCRVLIVTTFGRPGYLRQAMEAGATGFILKDAPASDLAAAIRRVAAGRRVVDPGLALDALTEGANPLTEREREVLAATTAQATVSEIAGILSLSEGTVRNHLSAAIQKVGARNRAEAARIARDKGWLEPMG